ncbi:MAG: SMP-30/gluconolactonase/LRE family protein [Chloroflexota bacterium]|nr:SMP-30/gluconolactonase/LRE family protein [Chloroflexota bacterium]
MANGLSNIVESGEAERLATGFVFTEGPLWHPDGYLLFVDIRRSQIFRLVPGEEPTIIRENSGESNGMTFDAQGRVVICEMVNRRVTRMESDGSYTPIAETSEGKRINRPNDVVLKSDGSLYFTNPGRDRLDPADVDLQYNSVHRIRPSGEVELIAPFEYPNGIAFSPDESVLYVANTRPGQYIVAYDLNADGDVVGVRHFADMPSEHANNGVPDGMKVDVEGRVYCTGPNGCWVFEPDGTLIGIIELPEYPANCGWGGEDNRTMYFTSNTSVYSLRMKTAGTRIPVA